MWCGVVSDGLSLFANRSGSSDKEEIRRGKVSRAPIRLPICKFAHHLKSVKNSCGKTVAPFYGGGARSERYILFNPTGLLLLRMDAEHRALQRVALGSTCHKGRLILSS